LAAPTEFKCHKDTLKISEESGWRHYLQKKSTRALSKAMYIGKRTVQRYIHLYNTTGEVASKAQSHHGPQPAMSDFELATILQVLFREPTTYLYKVQEGYWLLLSCCYYS